MKSTIYHKIKLNWFEKYFINHYSFMQNESIAKQSRESILLLFNPLTATLLLIGLISLRLRFWR